MPEETSQSSGGGSPPPGTDIEKLADKVYRLLRDDVRLERVRGVTGNPERRG